MAIGISKQKGQSFVSKVTDIEKALEACYLVAELNAKKRKSHTGGDYLTMPASKIIVGKILEQDALREIENIPLSNSRINRDIDDMSHDSQEVLHDKLKRTVSLSRLMSQQISLIKVML